jgi:hypothetical protein
MAKLTKRTVNATEIRSSDHIIWDEDLPGFGLRIFASGKRSYVILKSVLSPDNAGADEQATTADSAPNTVPVNIQIV